MPGPATGNKKGVWRNPGRLINSKNLFEELASGAADGDRSQEALFRRSCRRRGIRSRDSPLWTRQGCRASCDRGLRVSSRPRLHRRRSFSASLFPSDLAASIIPGVHLLELVGLACYRLPQVLLCGLDALEGPQVVSSMDCLSLGCCTKEPRRLGIAILVGSGCKSLVPAVCLGLARKSIFQIVFNLCRWFFTFVLGQISWSENFPDE